MEFKKFYNINVWNEARKVNKDIFIILKRRNKGNFSFFEQHILKTSGSIMDNIAEGFARDGNREFVQFLSYSKGSVAELQSQLFRARDIEIISHEDQNKIHLKLENIGAQLGGFMKYLKSSKYRGHKFK